MNSQSSALLVNPHPCGHIVYPYTDDAHVIAAVSLFASAGLSREEGVILILTDDHCAPIRRRLEQEGFNLHAIEGSGQLMCVDAHALIAGFMVDRMPDEALFYACVGPLIERAARSNVGDGRRPVRIFGEMVSLLWTNSSTAAERLELMWNDIIDKYSVALLCTYSLSGRRETELPNELVRCHSHRLSDEAA
jgi:hypothetical protein